MTKLDPDAPESAANAVRQDTRKHTRHCLRPDAEMVERYLRGDGYPWEQFAQDYRDLLTSRMDANRAPFDELAELAASRDVYLGCSCPTKKNPDVRHCHTFLALQFMAQHFPDLPIVYPGDGELEHH